MFLTIASVVGVVNSVVMGSAAGLGLNLVVDQPSCWPWEPVSW